MQVIQDLLKIVVDIAIFRVGIKGAIGIVALLVVFAILLSLFGKSQKGGGSDWAGSFYARTVVGGPSKISEATLRNLDQAPIFNPLSSDTILPTETTGIVPTGLYLAELDKIEQQASADINVQQAEASRYPVIAEEVQGDIERLH